MEPPPEKTEPNLCKDIISIHDIFDLLTVSLELRKIGIAYMDTYPTMARLLVGFGDDLENNLRDLLS